MKYVILLGDGMADDPLAVLGDKTPWNMPAPPIWTGWPRREPWD